MRTRPQNPAILITIVALAVALTFAASGGALARSTFQSSILPPPDSTETATPEPIFTPVDLPTVPPLVPEATPPVTFIVEATPTQPFVVDVTPTASGFLPPPTLVNPNALVPARLTPMAPEIGPLVGPAAPPEPTPTRPSPAAPGAAELIDSSVVALSYLWLCCGALLLVAAGLAVLWLWRRSKRR